jgi:hypothetical protein
MVFNNDFDDFVMDYDFINKFEAASVEIFDLAAVTRLQLNVAMFLLCRIVQLSKKIIVQTSFRPCCLARPFSYPEGIKCL